MIDHGSDSAIPALPTDGWRTSSRCGPNGGNCVEVNLGGTGIVGVRDTKPGNSPVLVFGNSDWYSFVSAARGGMLRP
ncbi:MAG TPA: DUF397 domain-containing protein [Pseudonocardiaceae bacterium]|nr:DUF397 domain-containing protein [Pseudonocardiaceae bacterium]